MKLYIYDHCPYCIKARIIFGIKNTPFELITLQNDDEKTPISMVGQKIVPILEKDDGSFMPESMDIIHYVDQNYSGDSIMKPEGHNNNEKITEWLNNSREYLYKLAMPRWASAKLEEFQSQSAIDYFTNKKEAMIGSFQENLSNSNELIKIANNHLIDLSKIIQDFDINEFSENDIHIFAALRSLSIVKGINFPDNIAKYAKELSDISNIEMHFDIAL